MLLMSDLLLEAQPMPSMKTGYIFQSDIMEDPPQSLSVATILEDQEGKSKIKMPLTQLSANAKDWILKWKWVLLLEGI